MGVIFSLRLSPKDTVMDAGMLMSAIHHKVYLMFLFIVFSLPETNGKTEKTEGKIEWNSCQLRLLSDFLSPHGSVTWLVYCHGNVWTAFTGFITTPHPTSTSTHTHTRLFRRLLSITLLQALHLPMNFDEWIAVYSRKNNKTYLPRCRNMMLITYNEYKVY